jgi:hypothetical protein
MPHANDFRWFVLMALGAATSCGCSGLLRNYDYFNPGDLRRQKSIAIAHDPYPLNDLGPPIVGGRPPGFDKPLSEVQRAQLFNPPRRALQPLPTLQPTVVSPAAVPGSAPLLPPVQTVPAPYSSGPAPPPAVQTYPPPGAATYATPNVGLN